MDSHSEEEGVLGFWIRQVKPTELINSISGNIDNNSVYTKIIFSKSSFRFVSQCDKSIQIRFLFYFNRLLIEFNNFF